MDNNLTKQTGAHIESIASHFIDLGGEFVLPADRLARRMLDIRAVVFDWDGVFNDGSKGAGHTSTFSEADSMGTNLLRYGLQLHRGRMPIAAVISGENNPSAREFVLREHFDCLYTGEISPITEAVMSVPAMIADGVAMVSSKLSIHGI